MISVFTARVNGGKPNVVAGPPRAIGLLEELPGPKVRSPVSYNIIPQTAVSVGNFSLLRRPFSRTPGRSFKRTAAPR